jgi:ferritin-like metal-binding protein YciE
MSISTFRELSLEGLKDLYDAEHQITEALPKMATAATAPELKEAFQTHLKQTKGQIERLDQIFELLGEKAERRKCVATQGLIAEANEHAKETAKGPVRDAGLIESAQKVEHYEIASYGTARTYARQAGQDDVARLLEETLQEEEQTDQLLTGIAESVVNERAASRR